MVEGVKEYIPVTWSSQRRAIDRKKNRKKENTATPRYPAEIAV
jgi:hypothetical protein